MGNPRVLTREGTYTLLTIEVVATFMTAILIYVLLSRPSLRRRTLSKIILMQAISDSIYSGTAIAYLIVLPCGPIENPYEFLAVAFSSTWVGVLAFHLSAQASGYWIEAERWMPYYFAFAAVVMVFWFCITFSQLHWTFEPCFANHPGGVRFNDKLTIALVFSTIIWCLICIAYTHLYLRVRLYSARFLSIYILCWTSQVIWVIFQYMGADEKTLHSPVWNLVTAIMLAMLGPFNAVAYGTMPPEFVLYRFSHSLKLEWAKPWRQWRPPCWCCFEYDDGIANDDLLRERLLNAASEPSELVGFDAAADDFLFAMVSRCGEQYEGLVLPPSLLQLEDEVGFGS